MEKFRKVCEFEPHMPLWESYRMAWLFSVLCTVQTWLHSFFRNLSWHWGKGDVTSAQFKNNLLLYAVQTVEKIVDIFTRDRALKECLLCRSQYGCWCATSTAPSVYDLIYMHVECSWTWWPYKEHSLIMWEHLKHYFSCHNTWSWTHCYVDGLAPCQKPESGDPALCETEELDVWRLLQWEFYYPLWMDLPTGAQL